MSHEEHRALLAQGPAVVMMSREIALDLLDRAAMGDKALEQAEAAKALAARLDRLTARVEALAEAVAKESRAGSRRAK